MIDYELMAPEDYDDLPEDAEEQFIEIERTCRRSLNRMLGNQKQEWYVRNIQVQYMTTVAAAAAELNIDGVQFPHGLDEPHLAFDNFLFQASAAVTRARLRKSSRSRPLSVQLSGRTRAAIELQITKLRAIIHAADLSEERRKDLLSKLDQLQGALNERRTSFARAGVILASLAAGLAVGTGFLADAPGALLTIQRLLGSDKYLEDQEVLRLGPPPARPALPAPTHVVSPELKEPDWNGFGGAEDDDVPF